jgi:hypothetical protein
MSNIREDSVGVSGGPSTSFSIEPSTPQMDYMELPDDEHLRAVGAVSIRHGHLHHTLRMTIKTILDLSVADAMLATHRQSTSELGKRVLSDGKKRISDPRAMAMLQAIINRAHLANDRRNKILHSLWSMRADGVRTMKDDPLIYIPEPSVAELTNLAHEILGIVQELNHARLRGFLAEAVKAK